MAEDTSILFIACGIAGNLTHLHIVTGEGWVVEYHAVLAVEVFLTAVKCLVNHTVFLTDTCHGAEAL